MQHFTGLGLADRIAAALASFGFESPTPVQAQAIPLLLEGKDILMESETGTGKTFAYLAPILQLIDNSERVEAGGGARRKTGEPGALVAAPTQELAVQIGREAERFIMAAGMDVRVAVLLGGTTLEKQIVKLKDKPDLIVGTLGRLRDLVAIGKLSPKSLRVLVLDEADRLFAPETAETAKDLLEAAPPSCARVLVSATLPDRLRREARPLLNDPIEVSVGAEGVLSGSIEHWCFYCDGRKRLDFVRRLEASIRPERCLVFLSIASRVESAAERLASIGLPIAAIHAGMDKEDRRVALERFSSGQLRYLLTSDLGARGLDIPAVSHILSLDLPEEPTIYTHRAGRTGRAGAKGVSIVLADGIELGRASRMATRGHFVFRCKILEAGSILEPSSEEFFARAASAEDDRLAAKAAKRHDDEGPKPFKRAPRPSSGREDGARPYVRRPPREDEGPRRRDISADSGESTDLPNGARLRKRPSAPFSGEEKTERRPEGRPERRPYFQRDGNESRPFVKRDGSDHRPESRPEGRPFVKRDGPDHRPENRPPRPYVRRDSPDGRPEGRPFVKRDGPDHRQGSRPEGRPFVKRDGSDHRPENRQEGRPFVKRDGPDHRQGSRPEGRPFVKRDGSDQRPESRPPRPYVKRDGSDGRQEGRPFVKRDGPDHRQAYRPEGRPYVKRDSPDSRPSRPYPKREEGSNPRPYARREAPSGRPDIAKRGQDPRAHRPFPRHDGPKKPDRER